MIKTFIVSFIVIVIILLICNYVDISCTVAHNSASILISSIIWLPIALILYFVSLYKSQSKISKIVFFITYLAVLFWFLNIVFTLSGCGNIDHSDDIKKVAIPMQQELEKFHNQTKRLPTMEERDVLLRKIGCKMQGNICIYGKERIKIKN